MSYQIEPIEGLGYLLFEVKEGQINRHVHGVFQTLAEARDYLGNDRFSGLQLRNVDSFEKSLSIPSFYR